MALKNRFPKGARPASRSQNKLRIIAGSHRGRKVEFPVVEGLRPTSDRVRETLFNWLGSDIEGSYCLDLFAGSGALSLEALSRGAATAVMIDQNHIVAGHLRSALELLDLKNGEVIQADTLSWIEKPKQPADAPFDHVFIDPPFKRGMVEKCCEKIEKSGILSPKCKIYTEHEAACKVQPPHNWALYRSKKAGDLIYSLYLRSGQE